MSEQRATFCAKWNSAARELQENKLLSFCPPPARAQKLNFEEEAKEKVKKLSHYIYYIIYFVCFISVLSAYARAGRHQKERK
jgi:hypothetical protein